MRIQKVARNGSKLDDGPSTRSKFEGGPSILTMHECLLWEEIKDLVLAPTRELAEQEYVQHVMSPLLGSEHVDVGVSLSLNNFTESGCFYEYFCSRTGKHYYLFCCFQEGKALEEFHSNILVSC